MRSLKGKSSARSRTFEEVFAFSLLLFKIFTGQTTKAVFTLGDIDFNFICLNGTFDIDVKI